MKNKKSQSSLEVNASFLTNFSLANNNKRFNLSYEYGEIDEKTLAFLS